MFNGDLATFSPAELLMFLTHMGKEGVLAVTKGDESLSVSFKDGLLVDAQSDRADAKVLRALFFRGLITKGQLSYISKAKKETGLPLRQILDGVDLPSVPRALKILEVGILEVLFQLFLWENGKFQFTEIQVERYPRPITYECQGLTLEIARRVDEYREILRSTTSLSGLPVLTSKGRGANGVSPPERYVLDQANGNKSIGWIVTVAPYPSYDVVKAVDKCLSEGWIEYFKGGHKVVSAPGSPRRDQLFLDYKRSLKKILLSNEPQPKFAEIIGFCRDHFDFTLLVASRDGDLDHCVRYTRDNNGQIERTDIENVRGRLNGEPILYWVSKSKLPFLGKVFSSKLFERIDARPPDGECAIVPLGRLDGLDFLLVAASACAGGSPGPFHYLELISWQLNPPIGDEQRAAQLQQALANRKPAQTICLPNEPPDKMSRVAKGVEELPPMPEACARILEVLSDPDGTASDRSGIGVWGQPLWRHSVECGLASRKIAETTGYADPEEAFVGGLLHDIGKALLLVKMPDDYRAIQNKQASGNTHSIDVEQELVGFDHTALGELLLQEWNKPAGLRACVRYHHQPQDGNGYADLAAIVSCGNYLSHTYGDRADTAPGEDAVLEKVQKDLDLSDEQVRSLLQEIIEDFNHSDFLN
jgi:HD-like signal output (HDOD) protein